MQIGLIGAGAMARAMARGWRRPLLIADPIPERAASLAAECGGEALPDNRAVAERADLIVLAHKPPQLRAVAEELAGAPRAVASLLALTPLSALKEAYPGCPVYRFIPSLAVALRKGAVVQAADAPQQEQLDRAVAEAFAELGELVVLEDSQLDCAMALMSCAPAYLALVAEAQVDAGVRRDLSWRPLKAARRCLRSAAWTRSRCAARSPRRAGRQRAGLTRWSAVACGAHSARRSTPRSSAEGDRACGRVAYPCKRAHRRGGLPLHGHLHLHASDLPVRGAPAAAPAGHAHPLQPRHRCAPHLPA